MYCFDVVGYVFESTAYCSEECLPGDFTAKDVDMVTPIFADSEWDSYPRCDSCEEVINSVSLAHYPCKNCGFKGANVQETGDPDQCLRCHRTSDKIRLLLKGVHQNTGKVAQLPAVSFPGGYPLVYVTRNNEYLCPSCAEDNLYEKHFDPPVDYAIHEEGPAITCSGCTELIDSAYGDPAEEES